MTRSGILFVAAALAVVPVACKDEARKQADKAAQKVQEQREHLREEGKALKEEGKALKEHGKELGEQKGELKIAEADFAVRRDNRVAELRALHGVIASQPMLINTLAGVTALTDIARANLAEKMQVFQMRIDDADNAIEALHGADASGFEDRNDAAAKAMEGLEEARKAAWEALNDGDRIEAS